MDKPDAVAASKSATAKLAEHFCGINYQSLDAVVVSTVKRLITDGISVAIAGSREEAPTIFAEHIRDSACVPLATAWGFGFKTTPSNAACLNGISMHVLDYEPMSNPPAHALSPTVPVAFALAEHKSLTGHDIITACAKGFEVQGRLLLAANPRRRSMAFHAPGVVGVIGAVVTAGHMLGLTPAQLAHAMGIAASRCGGLHANHGSMAKAMHCGSAAANGLEAALLAQRGFTAHPAILEAKDGYVETFFPKQFDYDALFASGQPYRCVSPGMAIKFYPSKYPTQFAIAAALQVRRLIGTSRKIKEVRVIAPDIGDVDRPQPRNGLEGKFSFQYTVAIALLDGKVTGASFTDERRFSTDAVELLEHTRLVRDPALSKDTRSMTVSVAVTLADGTEHMHACSKPPGFWGEPVDDELHRVKIDECFSARFDAAKSAEIVSLLSRLDQLNSAETAALIKSLG